MVRYKQFVVLAACLLVCLVACNNKPAPGVTNAGERATGNVAGAGSLLTIVDVEKASGKAGLKLVPRDPTKGAGGDLNFATADDKMLAMLVVADMSIFAQWKGHATYNAGAIPGVGDEAYKGPGGPTPYLIFFRKGEKVVSVSSFMDMATAKPYLSIGQLTELAKLVASRL